MPFLGRFGPQPRDAGCAATVGLAFGVPDAMVALVWQLVHGNRGELSPLLRLPRQKETQPCRGLAMRPNAECCVLVLEPAVCSQI